MHIKKKFYFIFPLYVHLKLTKYAVISSDMSLLYMLREEIMS